MESLAVDVFITGSYELNNDNVSFTFYKFDRHFNDEKISFQAPLNSNLANSAQEITRPYKLIPKKRIYTLHGRL